MNVPRARFPYRPAMSLFLMIWLVQGCSSGNQTPANSAKQPAPQKVVLEIDQLIGTPQVPLTVKAGQQEIKLEDIFKPAGIELRVRRDQVDLPAATEVTLGDLHALMLKHKSQNPLGQDEIGVHLIVATRETGRPQDLGIMFDYGDTDTDNLPREGFAVFASVHENLPAGRDPELMLTIAHELTHILNLHHGDWEAGRPGGSFDAGSTIESYSPANDVKWALSERSKLHLLSDPSKEKWPGIDNLAFGTLLREHFARHQTEPANEVWDVIEAAGLAEKGRLARSAVMQAAKSFPRDRSNVLETSPMQLKVEAAKSTYEVGEPLTVIVELRNNSAQPLYVRPLIDPAYGFLNIDIQPPDSDVFLPFRSIVTREARAAPTAIEPGASRHDEAKVFFGVGGWTFKNPGTYRFRADFPAPGATPAEALSSKKRIQSPVLELKVVAPRSAAGRSASVLMLGEQQGLFLALGGGDHLEGARKIVEAAAIAGASPQGDAARFAVATALLNPTLGETDQTVKAEEALKYLSQTTAAATGPFSVAQTYVDLAKTLDDQKKPAAAAQVRQKASARLGKIEAGSEALARSRIIK